MTTTINLGSFTLPAKVAVLSTSFIALPVHYWMNRWNDPSSFSLVFNLNTKLRVYILLGQVFRFSLFYLYLRHHGKPSFPFLFY
jgi:hypothetical protein